MQLIVRVLKDLQLRLPTSSNTTMADRVWQTMVFLAASALPLSERPAGARRKPLSWARLSQAYGSRRRLECGFCLVPFGLLPEP